ncbi:hypothetical protein Poli38472_014042 [Pythium oligandrum]|uniref:Uncharacterized protein n=1 Tax=Pythium oligandrum TaxID=41045 RepID=A0A8K1CNS1_PYTOL|nr:hypothetical protein Poli38472_014042 [Pythium oligandrum]|eukprot:TMW66730.1 hypothetical protein Poli38472_014042 [Pythium oligandrum]
MATKDVVVRRYVHGKHIYVAELCRPSVKNAFNNQMYSQLTQAIEEYEANDDLHALVITGSGQYFSSGGDISQGLSVDEQGKPVLPSKNFTRKLMEAMVKCPKILVAAVNGPAIGFGVTMLMHCDFVFAVETATFWTPFMRLGMVPEFGATYTFPHVLGPRLANDMLMRSRRINAQCALTHGLVSHVFPVEGFLAKVFEDLEPMVNTPTTAKNLPTYKRLLRREDEPRVREAIHVEYLELDRFFVTVLSQQRGNSLIKSVKSKL